VLIFCGLLLIAVFSAGCVGTTATTTKAAAATTGVGPTITSEPASRTIVAGQSATFSVTATGTVPLTYQWTMNGTPISGGAASSYTVLSATTSESGNQYAVVVTDATGSTPSSAATLTVTAAAVAPVITAQPSNQTVVAGQIATFAIAATGTSPMSFTYFHDRFWERV
jgi:hypothetical protein